MYGLAAAVIPGQTRLKDQVSRCPHVLFGQPDLGTVAVLRNLSSRVCLLLFLSLLATSGRTAALGDLAVTSAPGQPLTAEVSLIAVKVEEAFSLAANVIPQNDTYSGSNVATFEAAIKRRPDGQFHVRITSPRPVVAPFPNLLVELSWASGRVAREYSVPIAGSEHSVNAPELSRMPANEVRVFPEPALPREKAGATKVGIVPATDNNTSGTSGMATGKIRRASEGPDGERGAAEFFNAEHAGGPLQFDPMPRVTDPQANHIAELLEPGPFERMLDKVSTNAAYIGTVLFLLAAVMVGGHLLISRRSQKPSASLDEDALRRVSKSPIPSMTSSAERGEEMTTGRARMDEAARAVAPTPAERQSGTGINGEQASPAQDGSPAGSADGVSEITGDPFGEASSRSVAASLEHAVAEIDLAAGDRSPAGSGEAEVGQGRKGRGNNPYWREMPSGIDLAWMYQEMGDTDAAIRVLEEILLEGDSRQQQSARSMLSRLKNAGAR